MVGVVLKTPPPADSRAVKLPVCSQNSSATSDELIAAVEAVGQAASRQTYCWVRLTHPAMIKIRN